MTYMQSADTQITISCDTFTRHLLRIQSPHARAYIHLDIVAIKTQHGVSSHLTRARIYTAIRILAVTCHLPNVWGAMPGSIPASRRLFSATPEHGRTPMLGGATPVKWHAKTTYARMRGASLFLNHTPQWSNTNIFDYLRIYFMIYDTAGGSLRHRGGVITVPRWNFHSTTVEFLRYRGGI